MANVPNTNWDETKPAGTRDINLGDDDIREFKSQIRQIIEVDHEIEGSGAGEAWGRHNIITLIAQAALTTVANCGRVGAKLVGTIVELFYRDSDGNDIQITSNGSINVTMPSATIVGEIRGYSGATAPAGWFLCDGSAIDRVAYSNLFAVTGILYGPGDGATTFNIPDLRGRVGVGKSTDTEFDTLGETGGEKTHTLTEAELPVVAPHTHSVEAGGTAGGGGAWIPRTGGSLSTAAGGGFGSGDAHNNLQPYQVINYIIKY